MTKANYTTTLLVDQTPEEVFNAIMNVREWWSGEIHGDTNKLNDEFTYQVSDVHFSKQKVVELIPQKKLAWLVTQSNLSFIEDKSEWTGTKIVIDVAVENNKTKITFTHEGLMPKVECYVACSGAWSQIIHESLFSLITTGQGKKIF
jgi:hypothetical protein